MQSRFVDECCNPVTPALFAPRDVECRYAIPDWLKRYFNCGPGKYLRMSIMSSTVTQPLFRPQGQQQKKRQAPM
jgi:hypothetical protein